MFIQYQPKRLQLTHLWFKTPFINLQIIIAMKRKMFLIIGLVGILGMFSSCEKEGEKVFILDNVNPPVLGDLPNLTLQRANSADVLTFTVGTVDPGFQASAEYFLEVDLAGHNFASPIVLYSGSKGGEIEIVAAALNSMLSDKFEPEVATPAEFRVRAVLNVDAGQGAPGSGANPMVYYSATRNAEVKLFGLPRLTLVGSGMDQIIQSEAGDGIYRGFVKLNPANPFTLTNPDDGTVYGGTGNNDGGNIQVNGPAITPPSTPGWHILTVNLNTNTYTYFAYRMGVVGSATPNGWDGPDSKMDYNFTTRVWEKTLDLVPGHFKFRRNDGWSFNFGFVEGNPPIGPLPWVDIALQRGGVGNDFEITQGGNYTITLRIAANEQSATTTIIKN